MPKKAAEHHKKASEHFTHAAHHDEEAAKHGESGNHERAAHHAAIARGHDLLAPSTLTRQGRLTLRTTGRCTIEGRADQGALSCPLF